MKWVRNVFPKYDLWAKCLSEIWFGGETSFWNMVWVRNVFLKYGLGAKCLSEIWLGCETSSWTMKTEAKRISYLWGGGETSFPKYELGAKRLTKKMVRTDHGAKNLCTENTDLTTQGQIWLGVKGDRNPIKVSGFQIWKKPCRLSDLFSLCPYHRLLH